MSHKTGDTKRNYEHHWLTRDRQYFDSWEIWVSSVRRWRLPLGLLPCHLPHKRFRRLSPLKGPLGELWKENVNPDSQRRGIGRVLLGQSGGELGGVFEAMVLNPSCIQIRLHSESWGIGFQYTFFGGRDTQFNP